MTTVVVTAEETLEMVSEMLQNKFPSTVFAVRLEDPVVDQDDICGVDVIWVEGPSRRQSGRPSRSIPKRELGPIDRRARYSCPLRCQRRWRLDPSPIQY